LIGLIRLALRARRAESELVLAELLPLAPNGVEERSLGDDVVEYAVYGAPGELPALPDLRAAAGGALVEVSTSEVADDWTERWREFHRPLVLGDRLAVRPPWSEQGSAELDVVIDPGQAFGTGAHATTRLCLELLLAVADEGLERGSFADVGCGSGVLAIVAARLGFEPVTALDIERQSVEATLSNAAANGVSVDSRRFDLRSEAVPAASLAAANVLAPPLLEWASSGRGAWPARLILSGILVTEADRIADAFGAHALIERERRVRDEWAALLLSQA
jgi:ribosomal protein L11 methyltransferase